VNPHEKFRFFVVRDTTPADKNKISAKKPITPAYKIVKKIKRMVNRMGIFDKLSGKPAALTPKSALVLSAITVIAADGVIDEAEINDLAKIVRGDRKSIDTAMQVLKANPFPGVIDLIAKTLDEKQKIATLAVLCDLAMADGVLAGEEKKILQMYMDKFGISEAKLTPIIEAIAIKNDFSIFT
jgi:uncharacterized tellurite resistance protein B-like protein